MRIEIVTPAPPRSRAGNRVTALRWAKLLRELGHGVAVHERWSGRTVDVLVALHAEKSADSIERCVARAPRTPIVVAMTGTDIYGPLERSRAALASLELARRIVVLQPLGIDRMPEPFRAKTRAIEQSAPA